MRAILLPFLLVSAGLAACVDSTTGATAPGSDRDAHGCIASAGYSWCLRTNQCERPWELAKARAFENTVQAFDAFCNAPADGGR